jgi:hypothetical protein
MLFLPLQNTHQKKKEKISKKESDRNIVHYKLKLTEFLRHSPSSLRPSFPAKLAPASQLKVVVTPVGVGNVIRYAATTTTLLDVVVIEIVIVDHRNVVVLIIVAAVTPAGMSMSYSGQKQPEDVNQLNIEFFFLNVPALDRAAPMKAPAAIPTTASPAYDGPESRTTTVVFMLDEIGCC